MTKYNRDNVRENVVNDYKANGIDLDEDTIEMWTDYLWEQLQATLWDFRAVDKLMETCTPKKEDNYKNGLDLLKKLW